MEKRGQFYLLVAIVIIALIGGFAAVANYTKKTSSAKIYDLKDELGIETGKVLEYGVTQGDTFLVGDESVDIYDHFTEQFSEYAGENKEIYFIFGNRNKVTLITYADIVVGDIGFIEEGSRTNYPVPGEIVTKETLPISEENIIEVELGGITYTFELKPGENFFFIISQEIEGEQHVAIS